jgi:tetratricopeptide (TPR) repeat protein
MALPKVIIRYSDWMGTLAVLSVFSVIFAYFLAYYDGKFDDTQKIDSETPLCLSEFSTQDVSAALFAPPQEMIQGSTDHIECEAEIAAPACVQSCLEEQISLSIETETVSVNEAGSIPETFDEQLELAFHMKEQKNYHSAAKLFQKVLDANPDSEAAPLVILQIVDSLKHVREYQQAIKLLSDSLNFSAIQGKSATERQIHDLLSKMQQLQESEKTGGSTV